MKFGVSDLQESWTAAAACEVVEAVVASLGPSLLFTTSLKSVRVLHWAEGAPAPVLITQVRPISGRMRQPVMLLSAPNSQLQLWLFQKVHGTASP